MRTVFLFHFGHEDAQSLCRVSSSSIALQKLLKLNVITDFIDAPSFYGANGGLIPIRTLAWKTFDITLMSLQTFLRRNRRM